MTGAESSRATLRAAALLAALLSALAALAALAGCSHLGGSTPHNWHPHWPWRHTPAGPEPVVSELVVGASGLGAVGPVLGQTWDRNALRVDLAGLSGEGDLTLRPVQGHGWPIRLEFAVPAGAFAHLEVRGAQRVILAVPASGGVSLLAVPQGTYAPATAELALHYGP